MILSTDTDRIVLEPLTTHHLEAAAALSRGEGWPHRYEDWALSVAISRGVVAMADGRLVGTALATPFGRVATLNLIIVAPEMRGRGLGRALVARAMELASDEWRLTATRDGLPLYRSLGFVEGGEIFQYQGPVAAVPRPEGANWAEPTDAEAILALDRAATGMDRTSLLTEIMRTGRFAVMREGNRLAGFAAIRPFGRGEVAGPTIARDRESAWRLLAFVLAGREGAFMRVDTQADSGLAPWLAEIGLTCVGGGIPMSLGKAPATPSPFRSFALAAQAFG